MTQSDRKIWHDGEREMQRAVDRDEKMQARGHVIVRDHMPQQHQDFFEAMPFVVLSVLDQSGRVWPILRTGAPGFMRTLSEKSLKITSAPLPGEPENLLFSVGSKISILGIELETRRRNRMNGTIVDVKGDKIQIAVDQSFGNCPRYIRSRDISDGNTSLPGSTEHRTVLSPKDKARIQVSDVLFIASRAPVLGDDPRDGIDVNHRGGRPGFVKVLNDNTLVFPDYDGNDFFNTFGNILRDARSAIMFPDFATGDMLTVNGSSEIILDDPASADLYGAARYLKFTITQVIQTSAALPMRYVLNQPSEYSPPLGTF